MRTLFASLLTLAMLTACGYKGPLYLPEKPAAKPQPVTVTPVDASRPKADASGAK